MIAWSEHNGVGSRRRILMSTFPATSVLFKPVGIQDEQKPGYSTAASVRHLLRRLTGCWHRKMTRPFTFGHRSYRTCLRCGMRRDFDLETWTMTGPYYREAATGPLYPDYLPPTLKLKSDVQCQTHEVKDERFRARAAKPSSENMSGAAAVHEEDEEAQLHDSPQRHGPCSSTHGLYVM
jgi:hypothetical protein